MVAPQLNDVNRDRVIDSKDSLIVKSLLGIKNPTGKSALADVNQDEKINGEDLQSVNKAISENQKITLCQAADFNDDQQVDDKDFELMKVSYNKEINSMTMPIDLNGSGFITGADLSLLLYVYGCSY